MKKKIFILSLISFVLFSSLAVFTFSDSEDPLISKSYLDKKMQELRTDIIRQVGGKKESNKDSDDIVIDSGNSSYNSGESESSSSKFVVLHFDKGQKVVLGASTELILRSGKCKLLDPTTNGIPDLTNGSNISLGQVIPLNHLLLSPRDDGRGIECQTETWLLIKGSYRTE